MIHYLARGRMVPTNIPNGPPQHVHRRHDETFYVLSGAPTFTSGGDTIEAKPGMLVTAPPGTPHTFANHGDETAVMLATITPDLYIGYFRELAAQPSRPGWLLPPSWDVAGGRPR